MDTRIAWPAEYLRRALLTKSGGPRCEKVILDIKGFPGAFKRPEFWTDGPGAEALEQFEAAGAHVERAKVPGAGKAPSEELIN